MEDKDKKSPFADKKAKGDSAFKDKKQSDNKEKGSVDKGVEHKEKDKIDFEPQLDCVHEAVRELFDGDLSDLEEMSELVTEFMVAMEDVLSEDLTQAQRMKKKMTMRRYKSKLKMTRNRAMRRRATGDRIKTRARRSAISGMKSKIAGGRDVSSLSAGEKNRIERLVKRRKSAVDRTARKLVISKKREDRERLSKRNDK